MEKKKSDKIDQSLRAQEAETLARMNQFISQIEGGNVSIEKDQAFLDRLRREGGGF